MFKFKKFLFFQPVVEDDVDNKVEAAALWEGRV